MKAFLSAVFIMCAAFNINLPLLVNENNTLDREYVPENLTAVKSTRDDGRATQYMCAEAAYALERLISDAESHGITDLSVTSAYRSYATQEFLYKGSDGRYVAKPGCSEHQSGLAVDIHNMKYASVSFAATAEYAYLRDNAHRFGFILRYPEGKESITRIPFEPWHLRYVGKEHVLFIYTNGLCLEEYIEIINNRNTG